MLAEYQVHAFLELCEQRVGRPLDRLRSSLASGRKFGALWELVTLYVASKVTTVDHEPNDACPDVLLDPRGVDRMWLEARFAESRVGKATSKLSEFALWVHRQLMKSSVDASDWHLRIDGVSAGKDPVLPATQEWKSITRTSEWQEFVGSLRRGSAHSLVLATEGFSSIVRATLSPNPNGHVSSGFAVPTTVDSVRRHPAYVATKAKAEQAKGFEIADDPLVVCIGVTQESGFFGTKFYPNVGAEEAVLAALHDTQKWTAIQQANLVPRTEGKKHRVAGSGRISGVLLVSIEDRPLGVMMGFERRAEARYVPNQQADFPLSGSQQRMVLSLPFGSIKFAGDGVVHWAVAQRGSDYRSHDTGKQLGMAFGSDGSLTLTIPEQDLMRILTGKATPTEVFKKYGNESVLKALEKEPPIQRIEHIPGDAESQIPHRVEIQFGPPRQRLF